MRQRLILFAIGLMLLVPLIVYAQDTNDDDLFVPLPSVAPPFNPDELTLATPMQEELIEYPVNGQTDPCVDDDPDDLVVPLCPDTSTPTVPPLTSTPYPWPVPVDGLYSRQFVGSTTRSGDCSDYEGGDNDGPSRDYFDPEDPGQQGYVCTWPQRGIALVDNNTFYWRNGQYKTDTWIDSYDNSTSSRVLNIISPTELEIVQTTNAGSCTLTSVIRYELIQAGMAFGCTTTLPEESQEDPQPTPVPGDVSEEDSQIIDPPTIVEGTYTLTWLPFDSYCDSNYAPTFNELTLVKGSESKIVLYINGETYPISGERARGEYSSYDDNLNITLTRRFPTDFNMVWQASSDDYSRSCYAQGVVTLGTPLTTEDRSALNPAPPALQAEPGPITIDPDGYVSDDGESDYEFEPVVVSAGDYSATWTPLEGVCDSEELLPNFAQANVTKNAAGGYQLDYEGGSYTLDDYGGVVFYSGNENGDTVSFMVDSASTDHISATYARFSADGNHMCMATVILNAN